MNLRYMPESFVSVGIVRLSSLSIGELLESVGKGLTTHGSSTGLDVEYG